MVIVAAKLAMVDDSGNDGGDGDSGGEGGGHAWQWV
jgi:hypothetical protein